MKIFQRLLIAGFLFAWGAVPVFAQGQFSLLPFTNKTPEECKEVLKNFDKEQKIPNESYIKNVAAAEKAQEEASAKTNAALSAIDANTKAQQEMNDCIEKHGAGGSACSALEYNAVDAKSALDKAQADAKKANDDLSAASKNAPTDSTLKAADMLGLKDHLLGCGIKTGRISLAMIPYYFTYLINFLLGLSGIICVLFIVIGGYHYVIGGIIEEKEKGKNTIKHALMGMGLALLAWTIVTVLINAITG